MKHILKKSRIQYLIDNRNGYLVLASGSIVLNIMLSLIIYWCLGYEKIVLIPPTITNPSWVSQHKVSATYLASMSLFLSELRFNMTPTNAAAQRQLFLEYVDPSYYEKLKAELMEQEEHLKKEHVSISFYLSGVPRVDADKLIAQVPGDIQYAVGEAFQPLQHIVYKISYRLASGKLMIKSIEEIKDNA